MSITDSDLVEPPRTTSRAPRRATEPTDRRRFVALGSDQTGRGRTPSRNRFRYLWPYIAAVLVPAVLAGLGVASLSTTSSSYTAVARVALTDDVVWPFYDSVRLWTTTEIDRPVVEQAVQASVPDPGALIGVEVAMPPQQAYIDVIARANTAETATAAVSEAADLLVEREAADRAAPLEADLASATTELSRIQVALELDDERLTGAIDQEAALLAAQRSADPAELDAATRELLTAQLSSSALQSTRDGHLAERADAVAALADIELQLASPPRGLTVIDSGRLTEFPDSGRGAITTGLVVALIVSGIASVLAYLFYREYGRLDSARQFGRDGLPRALGWLTSGEEDTVTSLRLLDRSIDDDLTIVGFTTSDPGIGEVAIDRVASLISGSGYRVTTVHRYSADDARRPLPAGGTDRNPFAGPSIPASGSAPVSYAWPKGQAANEIASVMDGLDAVAEQSTIVLVDCGALGADDQWRLRARTCEAVVVAATPGSLRVNGLRQHLELLGDEPVVIGTVLVDRPLV